MGNSSNSVASKLELRVFAALASLSGLDALSFASIEVVGDSLIGAVSDLLGDKASSSSFVSESEGFSPSTSESSKPKSRSSKLSKSSSSSRSKIKSALSSPESLKSSKSSKSSALSFNSCQILSASLLPSRSSSSSSLDVCIPEISCKISS